MNNIYLFIELAPKQSIIAKECTRLIDLLTNIGDKDWKEENGNKHATLVPSYFMTVL